MLYICVLVILILVLSFVVLRFYTPFYHKGNNVIYSLPRIKRKPSEVLNGKRIYALGSSITLGISSFRVSFLDYIRKITGAKVYNDSVSSSTLATINRHSFVPRMRKHKDRLDADLILVQISTNDTVFRRKIGSVDGEIDEHTTIGGIREIIRIAKENSSCPIVFFSTPRFGNPNYEHLINKAKQVFKTEGVHFIDTWNDKDFNNVTKEQLSLYMNDTIHPTKAGYLLWWTPYFIEKLEQILADNLK